MNNIKRIVDALISMKGDHVVIGMSEPIYLLKDQQKIYLLKKELSIREYGLIKQELASFSEGATRFAVQDRELLIEDQTDQMTIILNPKQPDTAAPLSPEENVEIHEETVNLKSVSTKQEEPPAEPSIEDLFQQYDTQTMDGVLMLMVRMGASDLHLNSKSIPYMRIDGEMRRIDQLSEISSEELWERLLAIMPKRNQQEFLEKNDTDFAHEIEGYGRFRSNVFRDHHGVGAVFRLIPSKIMSVEALKVPPVLLDLCKMPKGLLLVTGPTGSGKSTTLAALIDHINQTMPKHIITIEDPIEFVHQNKMALVNQREIHSHTDSFKKALRAALREDPDIILVGEMRDLETIAIAIEMAVTGHLVLGTLHTSTAVSTIDRIIDQFPPEQQSQIRTMLSDAIIGVVSQMLLKKITGGRVAAYEVLISNVAVSNLIREGKTYQISTIMQTGKKMGQQMINAHLSQLVKEGLVTSEEALTCAIDKENLKTMIRGVS